LIAALKKLDIMASDIQIAYLNADTKETTYFFAGPEFGVNQGRPVIICRALYG
jgi:hypothetical protein